MRHLWYIGTIDNDKDTTEDTMNVSKNLIRNRHYLAARRLDYVKPFIEAAKHARHAVAVASEAGASPAVIDLLCEAVLAAHEAQNKAIAAGIAAIHEANLAAVKAVS